MENEAMRKSDSLKALSKAQAEIQLWKSRFETEGMGRVEELESARNKLQAKIVQSEELVDVLTTKVANAEKSKTRMNNELDDLAMEYERVHAAALITEKRGKNFGKNLVEVLAPLLGDEGSSVHPLVLHGQVIELVVHPGLGLLSVGNLGGERVNQLLALDDLGLQLVAGGLKLFNAAHALSFKARLPQLDFSLGLGEGLQGVRLPHGLVLHLFSEVLKVGGHHLVLGQQRGTILALSIGQGFGVLQLGGDRDLTLVHVGNGS